MNCKLLLKTRKLFFLLFIGLLCNKLDASIITCTVSGNWSAGSTWGGGVAPVAADVVIIPATFTVTLTSSPSVTSLTVSTGGVLSYTSNRTLTLSGVLNLSGTAAITGTGATGTLKAATFSVSAAANATIGAVNITISGTSEIDGTLTFTSATGTPNLTGDVTLGAAGQILFTAAQTINMGGNLISTAGATIGGGGAIGIITVTGNFNSLTGGSTTLNGITLNISGNVSIAGTAVLDASASNNIISVGGNWSITSTSATPFKEGTSSVIFNGLSAQTVSTVLAAGETFYNLTYSNPAGVTMSGNLSIDAGGTINGTAATATMTVNGNFIPSATGTVTIAGTGSLTVTGTTTIPAVLLFSGTGKTTLSGNVTVAATGEIYFTAIANLTLTNNFSMTAGSILDGTATGVVTVGGTLTAGAGGTVTIGRPTITVTGTTAVNGTLLFSSATGISTLKGDVTVAASQAINFSAAQTVNMSGNLISTAGATIGGGAAIGIINVAGNFNLLTGGTTTLNKITLNVSGNVNIPGTAVLDGSAANVGLFVGGNWTATSSTTPDFITGTNMVTFNGASGTQLISSAVSGGEIFYNLTINNTSAASPGVQAQQTMNVNNAYVHTLGKLDLKGNSLNITGTYTSSSTSKFTAGSIITSVAGATVTISDVNVVKIIYFSGTNFGDATNGITINCNSGDSYFNGGIFYGTIAFTKTGNATNTCVGGCTFYGPCTFNTITGGDRWRFGSTNPDIFYNATFNHLCSAAGNNFITAWGSFGNQFYGTTTIFSQSPGGFYVGKVNGGSGNADFHGPVKVTVAKTGNVYFADSDPTDLNTTTFEDTIQVNSVALSTGDVFFGTTSSSTIKVLSTSHFVAGSILGATTVYLYGLTQTGTTYTHTINSTATGSVLKIGVLGASTFAGSTNFSFPTLLIANNTFNGASNNFTFSGSVASTTSNGNNIFASGTNTTFTHSGTAGFWLGISSIGADAFNGNVTFVQTNTGVLNPVYSAASTFAGNVSTVGSTAILTFGNGSGGLTINGTGAQTFSGSASYPPVIQNLTMNGTGSLTINTVASITGALTLTSGVLYTTAANTLTLASGSSTSGANNSSYIDGPVKKAGNTAFTFPVGTGSNYQPIAMGAPTNATDAFTAQYFHSNVYSVPAYTTTTWDPTINHLSGDEYWILNRTAGTSSVAVTIGWNASSGGVTNLAQLTVAKYDATLNAWKDVGNASTTGNATAGTITSNVVNSFSPFTLASTSSVSATNPLPIELLSFSAIPNGSKVDLKWETVTEINNAYFTIEKSKDGIAFTKLIDIPGADNSTSYKEYVETDYQPYTGTSYYRLKQTDNNGVYKYFPMVAVNFDNQRSIRLYPNPIDNTSNLSVEVNGYQNQEVIVVLRDIQGREFLSKVLLSSDNSQVFLVDETRTLFSGTYIVTASSNDKIYNYKLIVK
jgi:hypothetical protein